MIDVDHQISAVRREVGDRVLEAGTARVLTVSQTYAARQDELWDACTDADRIARWFMPVSGDLQVGGRYQLEGNASGTIERCDPPESFAATWEYGSEVSWIEVRLTAQDAGRTRFTLEHVAHVDDERWLEYGPGAVGVGWDLGLLGLAQHFWSTGAAVTPEEGAAWMATSEGVEFITRSSHLWGEASVAAGTDPAEARAAAERTTAFYTGAPSGAEG
jgi:uncharacterized protein YndB with AHSA1/START domain